MLWGELIEPTKIIEPYNETLNDKSAWERREWSRNVLLELKRASDTQKDQFLILTCMNYYSELLSGIQNYTIPLKGKKLGEWIPALRCLINSEGVQGIAVDHPLLKDHSPKAFECKSSMTTADRIRAHIQDKIRFASMNNQHSIDLISGDIHRELGLKNSMPNVCQVMRGLFRDGDLIIRTTSSGNSSTITMRYSTGKIRE